MNTKIALRLLVATVFVLSLGACATSKSVDEKIAAAQAQSSQKIESVSTQVEDLQQKQKATDVHLAQTDTQISQLSATAQDALKRAQDAGVVAGDVTVEEFFVLVRGVGQAAATLPAAPVTLDRAIEIICRGLAPAMPA